MTVEEAVIRIIKEQACLPAVQVTRESRLEEDLGLDSLDAWEIMMALEEEFNTEYPDDLGFLEQRTVGAIIDFCKSKVAA